VLKGEGMLARLLPITAHAILEEIRGCTYQLLMDRKNAMVWPDVDLDRTVMETGELISHAINGAGMKLDSPWERIFGDPQDIFRHRWCLIVPFQFDVIDIWDLFDS